MVGDHPRKVGPYDQTCGDWIYSKYWHIAATRQRRGGVAGDRLWYLCEVYWHAYQVIWLGKDYKLRYQRV